MPQITETLAGRYAFAVHQVLADHFPDLATSYLGMSVRGKIARQAASPDHRFEVIVTYTREWRLHPADVCDDPWRVRLGCHKDNWTEADRRFSDSVNARLRTIRLED
jgi:hypothetical protein